MIPNEDPRTVGGWLELRISEFTFKWIFPPILVWSVMWVVGDWWLNTDGGIVFPTVITIFFMALLGTYYYHTRPFSDWEPRRSPIMSRIRDRMEPRGNGASAAVFFLVYFLLHWVITLGIPGIVKGVGLYTTTGFTVFFLGMLVLKGGVILLRGADTPYDASLHTGAVTFGVLALASVNTMAYLLLPLIPVVGVTVWYFRSHTPIAVFAGFLIGAISGGLLL